MTPDELSRIREIYEEALALSGGARDEFLDRECQDDPQIRGEVDALLQAHAQVPKWLDETLPGEAWRTMASFPAMEGRRVGGYTLIREIGRGGMGFVYLAERSDGAFRKQAAIKFVLGSRSEAVMQRFQQEREILASLDHPNITRLLDGGVTEEGWPYFVMEYVDGTPIHNWCDERRLNVSRRVELFQQVIGAVQYAHQRLVVHRDLKPGNILVTEEGTVKLLDFGIAKVLAETGAGEPAETQTLARMMTPEYASPEQINGRAVTTLTDVYSLGAVLYLLLTGHKPYRLLSAAMHEMARVISEVEPTRPSVVVSTTESGGAEESAVTPDRVSAVREGDPGRLQKRLAGDLDSILLMALQKEPNRRYRSVESFADDLQRHLESRPIAAKEDTTWERARRFCRRNPAAVAAGGLFLASLVAGFVTVVWQARRTLEIARPESTDLPLAALITYFGLFGALALAAGLLFYRPDARKVLGGALGGIAYGAVIAGKWRLGAELGWWHSRFPNAPDPLRLFGPFTWLFVMGGTLAVSLLWLTGRRFGWKGQAIVLFFGGPYLEVRERLYFSSVLPMLSYAEGPWPFLSGIAITIFGVLLGLLILKCRRVQRPECLSCFLQALR